MTSMIEEEPKIVETFYPRKGRFMEQDENYQEMKALFTEAKIPVLSMGSGDILGKDAFSFTCLWPDKGERSEDRNDLSLVLLADRKSVV